MDVAVIGLKAESQEITRATRELGTFSRSAKNADNANDGLHRSTDRVSNSMRKFVGIAAGFVSVAAVTSVLKSAAGAFRQLDIALGETSTLIQGTAAEMEYLENTARSMGRTFGTSATSQVKAFYQALSAGADSVEDAGRTLEVANKLAIGGVTSIEVATDGLTSVMNAYGDRVGDATAVSDALFVAMRAGKTTIGELSSSLGRVAPLAATVGVGFDELTASIAALTKGGIATTEAVTGVRAILAAVAKPTSEAQKLSRALGLEFNTAALQAKGFQGFLQEVVDKTQGSTDALALLFGGVEALTPMLALAGQAGNDFNDIMVQMGVKTGATDTAFNKISGTVSQRYNVAMQKMADLMYEIGQKVLPIVVSGLEAVNNMMERFSRSMESALGASQRTVGGIAQEIETLQTQINLYERNLTETGEPTWQARLFGQDPAGEIAKARARIQELKQIRSAIEDVTENGPVSFDIARPSASPVGGSGATDYIDSVIAGLANVSTASRTASADFTDAWSGLRSEFEAFTPAQDAVWNSIQQGAERSNNAMQPFLNTFQSAFSSWIDKAVDGTFKLKDAMIDLGKQLLKMAMNQTIMRLFGSLFGGGVGTGMPTNIIPGFEKFAGGGYTGDGPRSGGMDGQGGRLAMIHPKETIIDHTRPMRGMNNNGGKSISINVDARGSTPGMEKRIRAEIDQALSQYDRGSYERFQRNHGTAQKRDFRYRNG